MEPTTNQFPEQEPDSIVYAVIAIFLIIVLFVTAFLIKWGYEILSQ